MAQAPPTPVGNDSTTYHGVTVPDPYRWLEEADSPQVKDWIRAQNEYTEEVVSRYPGGAALAERIGELSLTAPSRYSPRIAGNTLLFMRETPPLPQPVLVGQDWPEGEEKVLVDTNKAEHPSAITEFWPSPSGRYVAYGTAVGGSELTTIFFVDVTTGETLKDVLPDAGGGTTPPALVWDGDEKGVTYVKLPEGEAGQASLFHASLYHHTLGQAAKDDTPAFGQGLSRVAEWELSSNKSGSVAAAMVHFGDGAPYRLYMRSGKTWSKVLGPEANIRGGGKWLGDQILVVSFQDAARGKILAVSPDGIQETLLEQGQWAIKGAYPIADGILVNRVWGPDQRLEHWNLKGELVRVLDLPQSGVGYGAIASSQSSSKALITYSGWTTPMNWVSYDGESGAVETLFSLEPAGDYSQVRVTRGEAVSQDGTRIPLSILHLAEVKPNGDNPTILYGYGGFGVIKAPTFLGSTLAWLERGGVYVVANIRGGREYGEPWHQAGMQTRKQNCFDDFYAASRALVESGWTRPEKLGIMGGSNGGLLVGASLVQHPEAFRAVVGLVGIYDCFGHESFPNGQYNIPEYGTKTQPDQFKAIHAYSPIHNLKAGTNYPALLLQTGENDLRVAPWQSRKFAAAVQAATASSHPVVVLTQQNAGHGQGASFSQKVGKTALALTFLAQELGVPDRK